MRVNAVKQFLAVAAALICFSDFFGAPSAQGTRQMVQVAKDVYTMTGAGSNASFVVTDEGVLAFDSDIRNNDVPFIRKVTDKKIVYLFASHASGDHSTGAWYFREDKPVYIGTRDQIRAYYQNELKEFNERKAQGAPLYNPQNSPALDGLRPESDTAPGRIDVSG